MTPDPLFLQIKEDLPNFPDEIINDWLLPFAQTIGWPPSSSRWAAILPNGIEFWKTVEWQKRQMTLDDIGLTELAASAIMGMHAAYNLKENNIYKRLIPDGNERYMHAVRYFVENGGFPKPIILLEQEDGTFSIVDGSHRYLAWNASIKLHQEYQQAPQERRVAFLKKIMEGWGLKKVADVLTHQDVWVGRAK